MNPLLNGQNLEGWTERGDFDIQIKDDALYLNATHAFNNAWLFMEGDYRNFRSRSRNPLITQS